MQRAKRLTKNSARVRRRPATRAQILAPPPVTGDVRFTKKQRYVVVTNATTAQIRRSDLLSAYLMVTSANTGFSILEGVRIVSLEVWLPANSAATNALAGELTWLSDQGMPQTHVFVSNSTTMGTHWKGSPPPNSLAAFWSSHNSANLTQNMFYVNLPRETVIDVTYECLIQNGAQGGTLPGAVALATAGSAGTVYGKTLDFSAGTNQIVPIGISSIF